LCSGFGTRTATNITRNRSGNFEFDLFAKGRFLECNFKIIPQVISADRSCSGVSTKAEEVTKDIPERGKDVFKSMKTGKAGSPKAFVSVLVVDLTLFSIAQHFIGL